MPATFLCPAPCNGEVATGGDAPEGGGQCLRCGRVFDSGAAVASAGGGAAFVCVRGRGRVQKCAEPGCGDPTTPLCDEPVAGGRTCDRRMCDAHRTRVGRNRDRCPLHAPGAASRGR